MHICMSELVVLMHMIRNIDFLYCYASSISDGILRKSPSVVDGA